MEDNKNEKCLCIIFHGQNEFLGIHVNIAVSLSLPSTVKKYTPEAKKSQGT